jgi:hypothetical protein
MAAPEMIKAVPTTDAINISIGFFISSAPLTSRSVGQKGPARFT